MADSILNPTPIIDDTGDPWQNQGPMAAAEGNIGGLQRALIGNNSSGLQGPTDSMGVSGGLAGVRQPLGTFNQDSAEQVRQAMMARIRSPEQLQQGASDRRGALAQLQEAYKKPQDDNTWGTNYLAGEAAALSQPGISPQMASRAGMAFASMHNLANQQADRQGGIQSALQGLKFEQDEEKNADNSEKSALSDAAKILAVQARPNSAASMAAQTGLKFTKDGWFDLTKRDPQTGAPLLVRPASQNDTAVWQQAQREATRMALDQRTQFQSMEDMNSWINNTTQQLATQMLSSRGMVPNTAPAAGPAPAAAPTGASAPTAPSVPTGTNLLVQAVKQVESAGNPNAVSPKGAAGLMQIMPATGPEAAKLAGVDWDPNKLKDPEYNEKLGAAYLDAQMQRFGSKPMAVAAYNMGPDGLDKWLKAGGKWENLPSETRNYVGKVMMTEAQLAAKAAQPTAKVADAAGVAAPQGATDTPQTPVSPTLMTPGGIARQKAFAQNDEAQASKVRETWNKEADQGQEESNTVDNIRALRPMFEPNQFAEWKKNAGNYLQALGISNGLTQQAANLTDVQRMVQRVINNRMTLEHGVQTEGDAQRFANSYAKITDAPQAFDFALGEIKEESMRKMERQRIADELSQKQGSASGITKAWRDYNQNNLGPMLQVMPNTGKPMWRHEYIESAVQSTLKNHPDADPEEVRSAAANAWLTVGKRKQNAK